MSNERVISDSLFSEAQAEFAVGRNWIAYNTKTYFLDNADMWFFRNKDEAFQFADDNYNDVEAFAVIHANSIDDLLKQFPYGETLRTELLLNEKELQFVESLIKTFDWDTVFYDPLQDHTGVNTVLDKADLERMELLVDEWEKLYASSPELALEMGIRYWEGKPMENYKNDFLTIQFDLMNEKNFDYLKSNIRNHGFGETLGPAIEAQLKNGAAEFTLPYKTEVNKREMEATLYFGKSKDNDMYFFNKYDSRVKNEKNETVAQTFYINNGWGVTLKEAYNLLNGRTVHKELTNKEGEKYQAWVQLDFAAKDKHGNYERKQYHQNYGYEIKDVLNHYPIKELLKAEDAAMLIKSLEKGNVQMVTLELPDKDVKVFIEANPQYKSLTVYDNKMQRLDQDQRQEVMKQPEMKDVSKNKAKEQQQNLGTEGQDGKKSLKGKGKTNGSENDGLVKKTRTRTPGKGMGV